MSHGSRNKLQGLCNRGDARHAGTLAAMWPSRLGMLFKHKPSDVSHGIISV